MGRFRFSSRSKAIRSGTEQQSTFLIFNLRHRLIRKLLYMPKQLASPAAIPESGKSPGQAGNMNAGIPWTLFRAEQSALTYPLSDPISFCNRIIPETARKSETRRTREIY